MLRHFKSANGLLSRYAKLLCDTVVPFQEAVLNDRVENVEPSHAIDNFRNAATLLETGKKADNGDFYGMVFRDSDVAKWLEAAAYSLLIKPDEELEQRIDELCDLIAAAQEEAQKKQEARKKAVAAKKAERANKKNSKEEK